MESREKENRSTGDNNDESVRLGGRETDEGEDRMPRVFPPTYRSRPLSKTSREMRIPFLTHAFRRGERSSTQIVDESHLKRILRF